VNRQIRRLGAALLVCYAALFVQLNVLQLGRASEYNDSPLNNRKIVRDFTNPRGRIITADGVVVAESVPSDDRFRYQRTYPTGDLFSQVTGYFSFTYGSDGLEKTYNDQLAGQTQRQRVRGFLDLFVDKLRVGDLSLSMRADVQQVAKDELAGREGSVVALDPRTGAVLALWSAPAYDPNELASHDPEQTRLARERLLAEPGKPLLGNAYRERYFPGSTFKVVTAAAALEEGTVTATEPVYPVRREYVPPLTTRPLRNFGGSACGGNLFAILRVSCNTAFAEMGVQVGAAGMVAGAQAFGFNDTPPIDLPRPAPSRFPDTSFFEQNDPLLAQAAIGQNEVQATPLQMALAVAGIANGGTVMAPYTVEEVRDERGELIEETEPQVWHQAVSPATAATVRDAMVGVVQDGTASRMQIPGVTVAGKTGTAQLGTDPPSSHAWVVGFAPAENPRVAVAVLLKGQPGVSEVTGGTLAAPIARAVMETVLAAPDPLEGDPDAPPTTPPSSITVPPPDTGAPPDTSTPDTTTPEEETPPSATSTSAPPQDEEPDVTIVPPTTVPTASTPAPDAPPEAPPTDPSTTGAPTTDAPSTTATTSPSGPTTAAADSGPPGTGTTPSVG